MFKNCVGLWGVPWQPLAENLQQTYVLKYNIQNSHNIYAIINKFTLSEDYLYSQLW